ncbi:MAG TPA: outer membrane protein assembly factor BamD [Phycisphaerae bacterium]|nr:outer membrane protein assembly factor BamD [Phycisphaerae bacterium]
MRPGSLVCWLVPAMWVSLPGPAGAIPAGKPIPPPPDQRVEQLRFDPALDRWVEAPRPVPGTEDGDLDIARQYMAREDYKTALKVLDRWLKTYGAAGQRHPEALYLKATAELETNDYREAQDTYQQLLNNYPGSIYAERALSGQFRVAEQYLAGKRRKALGGLFYIKDRDGGVKIMDDLVVNYGDTPLAESAQLAKANYYYERGEFDLAQDEYARFARDFPRSRYQAKALLWSAYSALASFPGIKFDDAPLLEAQELFGQFMRAHPSQARELQVPVILEQVAATRADKTLDIARFYEKTGQKQAARFYYRAATERWPNTPAATEARSRLTKLGEDAPPEPLSGPPASAPEDNAATEGQ